MTSDQKLVGRLREAASDYTSGDDIRRARLLLSAAWQIEKLQRDLLKPVRRGVFLLDIEHDDAALQALETYAYAVSKAGDRPLCDELLEKIKEVRARRGQT